MIPPAPHPAWDANFIAPEIGLKPDEQAHIVQVYESDTFLVDLVTRFLGVGMVAGESLVAVLTQRHRAAICERLASVGFDVDEACASRQLRFLDARAMLDQIMIGEMPDPGRVDAHIGGALRERLPGAPRRRARVFGEMVDILWRDGRVDAAIHLEEIWNELQTRHAFSLLCAYCTANVYRETRSGGLDRICKTHTRTLTPQRVH